MYYTNRNQRRNSTGAIASNWSFYQQPSIYGYAQPQQSQYYYRGNSSGTPYSPAGPPAQQPVSTSVRVLEPVHVTYADGTEYDIDGDHHLVTTKQFTPRRVGRSRRKSKRGNKSSSDDESDDDDSSLHDDAQGGAAEVLSPDEELALSLISPVVQASATMSASKHRKLEHGKMGDAVLSSCSAVGSDPYFTATDGDLVLLRQAVGDTLPNPHGDVLEEEDEHLYHEMETMLTNLTTRSQSREYTDEGRKIFATLALKTREALDAFSGTHNKQAEERFLSTINICLTELDSFLALDYPGVSQLHKETQATVQECRTFELRLLEGGKNDPKTEAQLYERLQQLLAVNAERLEDTRRDLDDLGDLRKEGFEHHMHDLKDETDAAIERLNLEHSKHTTAEVAEHDQYKLLTKSVRAALLVVETKQNELEDEMSRITVAMEDLVRELLHTRALADDNHQRLELLRGAQDLIAERHMENTSTGRVRSSAMSRKAKAHAAVNDSASIASEVVDAVYETLGHMEAQRKDVLQRIQQKLMADALHLIFRKYHRASLNVLQASNRLSTLHQEKSSPECRDKERVEKDIVLTRDVLSSQKSVLSSAKAERSRVQQQLMEVSKEDAAKMEAAWRKVVDAVASIAEHQKSMMASAMDLAKM